MENSLKKSACVYMSGFKKIEYLSVKNLQSINIANFNTRSVTCKENTDFSLIETKKISLSNPSQDGSYNLDISCILKGVANQYDALLNQMVNDKYIIKLTDNNGVCWLAGSKEEPLNFSSNHIGDESPNGIHHYSLSFFRETTEPLYVMV